MSPLAVAWPWDGRVQRPLDGAQVAPDGGGTVRQLHRHLLVLAERNLHHRIHPGLELGVLAGALVHALQRVPLVEDAQLRRSLQVHLHHPALERDAALVVADDLLLSPPVLPPLLRAQRAQVLGLLVFFAARFVFFSQQGVHQHAAEHALVGAASVLPQQVQLLPHVLAHGRGDKAVVVLAAAVLAAVVAVLAALAALAALAGVIARALGLGSMLLFF